jgi:hypothetical protein
VAPNVHEQLDGVAREQPGELVRGVRGVAYREDSPDG